MISCLHRRVCRASTCARQLSTRASEVYTNPSKARYEAVSASPRDITPDQRRVLDAALRVDQAGELAANWIYRGQMAVLGGDPKIGPLIQEMWDQERHHLVVMDKLRIQHQVRPTILSDVAKATGFGLGVATALLGKEAAMACTEAVETVIGEHYDDQLKDLDSLSSSHPSMTLLSDVIREFRDDELGHLHVAVDHHSQRAPAHALLSTVVGYGCMVAIELCRKF
ncbi:COQ7 protein [Pisolithus orientalis]|uniref:COQ7 protein n=1 Tax=Pisolithus orientalis TaxID=936130 RepID=UPI0022257A91|nr:COQ7 protein [Pisolithus orientalis]KAI6028303.1 COQ7 protein [Pisolithus orientalis]